MKYLLYALTLFLLPMGMSTAQWIEDSAIDALIAQGIVDTYNLKFEAADAAFTRVVNNYPEHPAGHFFLAMVEWWRILIEIENDSRDRRFYKMLDDVIALCDKRLKQQESDIAGLFFKGGAIGFKGRLLATRKSWVRAATTGRQALPVVMDAAELAPDNADLAFGTGIYDYYAAVLPDRYPVLKPLMVFLPKGNRERGLKDLKRAAEHGHFANWEAQYFLMQTLYGIENKPSSALHYARELHAKFPDNPVFQRYLGRIFVKLGAWESAGEVFADILDRSASNKRGYTTIMQREASYYLGYQAMLNKDYGKAMKHLVECDRLSRGLDSEPSGFMVMANLRMGMVHDLLKQREYATKQYDKVLRMPDYRGSRDLARRYKRAAYSI